MKERWTGSVAPWEVLRVGVGATPQEVKAAFRTIAKTSHPDALQASLEMSNKCRVQREAEKEKASERFRMAVSAYEMYDMKSGRWAPGLASSVINAYSAKNRRAQAQHNYEDPPFDLRRFSAPRLHPKTRAAVMGVYLFAISCMAAESFMRTGGRKDWDS